MNGFHKVLKFRIWGTYSNARKIADEIIISLVKNSEIKEEEERDWLPTYVSTVKESILCVFDKVIYPDDEDEFNEDYVSNWTITIYEMNGNRKSKLSITQNEELYDVIFK